MKFEMLSSGVVRGRNGRLEGVRLLFVEALAEEYDKESRALLA
jgi:hypothetical protein